MRWLGSVAQPPANNGLAGWPSYGLLKEADGPGNLSRNHGEQMPGGQVQSNTPCGRDIRRDRPVGRANHRAVPVCKPDHHLARGLRRPTKPKVEGQTCCILSPYRGSFNVSIGFNEASCAGTKSWPGMLLPGGWGGLNNSVTKTAHEVSGGRNRSVNSALQNLRHFDTICGSMICTK